jgi:hypothetical protein
MLKRLLSRLRSLFVGRSRSAIDEELRFHIEKQIDANIATGMTKDEAHRQAVIAFGGVEGAREACHEQHPLSLLETSWYDIRYGLRGFRRSPMFTVTAILTLTIGIGTTAAVFSVVDRILFRPLPYADPSRLVSVGLIAPISPQEFVLGGWYYDWRRLCRNVDSCPLRREGRSANRSAIRMIGRIRNSQTNICCCDR